MKFSELENAFNHALGPAQSLGVPAEESVYKLSDEEIVAIPSEFAQIPYTAQQTDYSNR
jgi:hypothetical protein